MFLPPELLVCEDPKLIVQGIKYAALFFAALAAVVLLVVGLLFLLSQVITVPPFSGTELF